MHNKFLSALLTFIAGPYLLSFPVNDATLTTRAPGRKRGKKAREIFSVAVKLVAMVTVACSRSGAIE